MIAVTGATGLLGSAVARALTEEGESVVALKQSSGKTDLLHDLNDRLHWRACNILDPVSVIESLHDVDTVVHTAALVSFNPRMASRIHEVNVTGTKNVVDACLLQGVKKMIHISSVAALGRIQGIQEIREEVKWIPGPGASSYAASKYLAELEVFRGCEEGLVVSVINPSVIFGPGDWNRSSSQIFRYVWNESLFYTQGVINYVDVRDVAAMVRKLIHQDFNGEKFIANAGAISLENLFREIAKRFGKRPPVLKVNSTVTTLVAWAESVRSFITHREPLVTRQTASLARETFYFDNTKAVNSLGLNFRSLDDTLTWCCDHYARQNTINK